MADRENVIYGLYTAIGALRALKNKFPNTEEDIEPGIQACTEAVAMLKEQETSDTNQSRIFRCKKCGYGIDDIYLTDESAYPIGPNYCPNCGRLVKWE